MEEQVTRLVDKVWEEFLKTPPEKRLLIAIGGIPGSGKTTLSRTVTASINARYHQHIAAPGEPVAVFVPMDGFHLTRAQLSALPDPATAHARRGAEFTFDGDAFLRLVRALREPLQKQQGADDGSAAIVYAPSFDHATKDPVQDDIAVRSAHRVVVFEGNYVVLDREPWRSAAALMDQRWFVDVTLDVARARLRRRHVAAGIAATEAEADRRALENDLPNGREIITQRLPVDEVITSTEDKKWEHE